RLVRADATAADRVVGTAIAELKVELLGDRDEQLAVELVHTNLTGSRVRDKDAERHVEDRGLSVRRFVDELVATLTRTRREAELAGAHVDDLALHVRFDDVLLDGRLR